MREYMKICLWCKEPITGGRKDAKCHAGSCAVSYKWHKCSKDQKVEIPERYCPNCNELLVRRENEPSQAWGKRVFCNKSCKSYYSTKVVKPDYSYKEITIIRSGVKIYDRNSDEFKHIAALYC
jgi:hypothetical protein